MYMSKQNAVMFPFESLLYWKYNTQIFKTALIEDRYI
jgi:hypothetical protein